MAQGLLFRGLVKFSKSRFKVAKVNHKSIFTEVKSYWLPSDKNKGSILRAKNKTLITTGTENFLSYKLTRWNH